MSGEQTDIKISDAVLVVKAQEGVREAFDVLVLRYQDQAVAVAQSITKNFYMAKDAAQNAFAKAYLGIRGFRGDAQFKTWLIRIVLNEAKSLMRSERARRSIPLMQLPGAEEGELASILEIIPATGPTPGQAAEATELRDRLDQVVETLPERAREVFILRYFEQFSLQEIADTLEIALGTVKAHLSHGGEKVREILQKEGE
jgi:RNA polymerase sigma-70 factor, ECF subfamily